jgi:hypothetical protein
LLARRIEHPVAARQKPRDLRFFQNWPAGSQKGSQPIEPQSLGCGRSSRAPSPRRHWSGLVGFDMVREAVGVADAQRIETFGTRQKLAQAPLTERVQAPQFPAHSRSVRRSRAPEKLAARTPAARRIRFPNRRLQRAHLKNGAGNRVAGCAA